MQHTAKFYVRNAKTRRFSFFPWNLQLLIERKMRKTFPGVVSFLSFFFLKTQRIEIQSKAQLFIIVIFRQIIASSLYAMSSVKETSIGAERIGRKAYLIL